MSSSVNGNESKRKGKIRDLGRRRRKQKKNSNASQAPSSITNDDDSKENNNPQQGKCGIEKQPFQLPYFFAAIGIEKIRQLINKDPSKKISLF
nr:hypothetical protein CFP56_17987 [Quercus suber]